MRRKKSEWFLRLMGAACFAAVIFLWLMGKISWSGTGHEVVLMGDSVIGNVFPNGDPIDVVLEEKLDMEVFNAAFGGSGAVSFNEGDYESLGSESLCFEALVNAIVLRDFSAQDSAIERNSTLDYFPTRLQDLEETDFSKVNVLVVAFGANDYANQVPPDEFEESFGDSIGKLQTAFPDLKIYISSPVYNYLVRDGEYILCDSGKWGEYLLEEYVLAEERVADQYGVTFIDNYHDSIINEETVYHYAINGDGLHLEDDGRDWLTDNIAAAVLADAE